jgi:glycosyltransferase involved in cell wall biosynthesis
VRIAVISTPFISIPPPSYGGTELVVQNLLTALTKRGHQVSVYATGDSRAPGPVHARFATSVWPPQPYRELDHATFAIADLLARDQVDVIHAHVPSAAALARFIDAPLVYTVHHERDPALHGLYRGSACSTLTICAISARQAELLEQDRVHVPHVVHHGLDAERYRFTATPRGYAAYLGRFSPEKGPHTAIDVAAAAGVPILLAGKPHWRDGAYFDEEMAPRLQAPDVSWEGEAGFDAKVELLGGALATLFPVCWEEPFGLVMIESMLCGTPVLAYPRGAAPEIVDEGITGWIVRGPDEMRARLGELANGGLRLDRARCRAHAAERFSVARMTDRYLAIYREAAGLSAPTVTAPG